MPPGEPAEPPIDARERGSAILHEPRLLVLLLAGGVMATIVVFVIGVSGAFFTASSSDSGNTVGAGEVRLNVSSTDELINGAELKPGATRSATVTVTNLEEQARVTLRVSGLSETPPGGPSLAGLLNVTVRETAPGSAVRFAGKLSELTTAVPLGTWPPGEQRNIQIEIAWPAAQDSLTYANVKSTFAFDWQAESVP